MLKSLAFISLSMSSAIIIILLLAIPSYQHRAPTSIIITLGPNVDYLNVNLLPTRYTHQMPNEPRQKDDKAENIRKSAHLDQKQLQTLQEC
jgi:hypothetical protein